MYRATIDCQSWILLLGEDMSIGMQLCDMDGDDDDDDVYDHVISYVGYYSSFPAMKTYQKSTTKVD